MRWREVVRGSVEALKAVNLSSCRLALQKPEYLREYLSFCVRKYDDLIGRGLTKRSVLKELGPSDLDLVIVPARFQTGGGTDPREILTLAAVTRLLQPKRVFEIGTFKGRTTAIFILNSPAESEIFTLDLPPKVKGLNGYLSTDIDLVRDRRPDGFLTRAGLSGRYEQIYCDSMLFDPEPYRDTIELGFIDGAHAEEFVRNDTMKMAIMMSGCGYVFWHDYGGRGSFQPLSKYLESLPIKLYRVPGTSLAWTTAAEIKKLAPKPAKSDLLEDLKLRTG